jgi:hypothetical protein
LFFLGTLSVLSLAKGTDLAITNATNLPAIPSPKASTSPSPLPSASPSAATATNAPTLVTHDLPEIHGKIRVPQDWTLLPGKLLEGDVLLATREKITNENDPWTVGLSMTIDRNGAKDSGQKASDYAFSLAKEAREKAGDEASTIKESQSGPIHEIRFEFPIAGDQPLQVTEVLRANDSTGTLAVILWQMPKSEVTQLQSLRESILSGLMLGPNQ